MSRCQREVIDFLSELGAQDIHVRHRGKHPKIVYTFEEHTHSQTIPNTPGDTMRGLQNAISDIRRAVGLAKCEKTVGERPCNTPSRRVRRPIDIPTLSHLPDFRDVLAQHPAARSKGT